MDEDVKGGQDARNVGPLAGEDDPFAKAGCCGHRFQLSPRCTGGRDRASNDEQASGWETPGDTGEGRDGVRLTLVPIQATDDTNSWYVRWNVELSSNLRSCARRDVLDADRI